MTILVFKGYGIFTDYVIEDSKFKSEMIAFKAHANDHLNKLEDDGKILKVTVAHIAEEQARRTGNVKFAGEIRNGNKEIIDRLCHEIFNGQCK